jgi:hypothetical protein
LTEFGVTTQGKNPADDNSGVGGVVDPTKSVSKRPAHVRKLPAKFMHALTGSSVQASKIRRNAATTDDDEDKAQPRKKKPKTRLQVEGEPDSATE